MITDIEKKLLKKYCKYIVHMRQQYCSQNFGIVFGAGVSNEIGFPTWEELVERINNHPAIKDLGYVIDHKKTPITNAQGIFQTYKANRVAKSTEDQRAFNKIEMMTRAGWQEIVHNSLYKSILEDITLLIPKSNYLWQYIDIIKKIPMTINYNFDDTIQRMLASMRTEEEKSETRGYSTLWNSNVYMYPKTSVLYHPNGFLPFNLGSHPSEQLVFLEDSFADQLIESINGKYTVLTNYFTHNTCLLLGLSLNDPTLKHILRNHSLNFPGNYHYYISYIDDDDDNDDEKNRICEKATIDSNFEVYNLITLCLNKKEICSLGKLIKMTSEDFERIVEELGFNNSYKYILVGSVAVGKSTAMSYFRSLSTQDEWLEEMPADMRKDPTKVDENGINEIDKWVAEQWGKKNYKLLRIRDGIHLIDRGPLDAFAFTAKGEWRKKAYLTINGIKPGKSKTKLCSTCVILLLGDPETMAARAIANHRDTDSEKLSLQQSLLKYIYTSRGNQVKVLDTRNKGKTQVAKEIARIIYLDDYIEAPLDDWLSEISTGDFPEPSNEYHPLW